MFTKHRQLIRQIRIANPLIQSKLAHPTAWMSSDRFPQHIQPLRAASLDAPRMQAERRQDTRMFSRQFCHLWPVCFRHSVDDQSPNIQHFQFRPKFRQIRCQLRNLKMAMGIGQRHEAAKVRIVCMIDSKPRWRVGERFRQIPNSCRMEGVKFTNSAAGVLSHNSLIKTTNPSTSGESAPARNRQFPSATSFTSHTLEAQPFTKFSSTISSIFNGFALPPRATSALSRSCGSGRNSRRSLIWVSFNSTVTDSVEFLILQ